jgi:hypothetical protein
MDQEEYEEAFKPDFNANIDERIKLLEHELLYLEKNKLSAPLTTGSRLSDHFILIKAKEANIDTSAFGFKNNSNLDYKIKELLFKVFLKHFPDGIKTSQTGYPNAF